MIDMKYHLQFYLYVFFLLNYEPNLNSSQLVRQLLTITSKFLRFYTTVVIFHASNLNRCIEYSHFLTKTDTFPSSLFFLAIFFENCPWTPPKFNFSPDLIHFEIQIQQFCYFFLILLTKFNIFWLAASYEYGQKILGNFFCHFLRKLWSAILTACSLHVVSWSTCRPGNLVQNLGNLVPKSQMTIISKVCLFIRTSFARTQHYG